MTRACGLRRALLLSLAAAALIATAALALTPRPAAAQTVVWSATLTAKDILSGTYLGCHDYGNVHCAAAVTSDSFDYEGTSYRVTQVQLDTGGDRFWFSLDKVFELDTLSLIVDGESYALASGTVTGDVNDGDTRLWTVAGDWTVGQTVTLSLTVTRAHYTAVAAPTKPEVKGYAYHSTSLMVKQVSDTITGCNSAQGCADNLADDSFGWGNAGYRIKQLAMSGDDEELYFALDKAIPSNLIQGLTLEINGVKIPLSAGIRGNRYTTNDQLIFIAPPGLSLSVGSSVRIRLTAVRDFPSLEQHSLPQHVPTRPASQRRPENGSASDAFCYVGAGNSATTIIRYPDGRVGEVPTPHSSTMKMFACN